jgi:intracellular sulfur oxidation DsrE/DsrF family protein
MQTANEKTPRLVIDFEHSDTQKQDHLLLYITNLLRDFDSQPLVVEVVAYGPGVMLLVRGKTEFSERIKELQFKGVVFRTCRNAMNTFDIQDNLLLEDVTPVPSGVGRIVRAQLEGSVYFKG